MENARPARNGGLEQLIAQLSAYIPENEQEQTDRELMLQLLHTQKDLLFRSNRMCHLTASAWVVNPQRTKVLMAYHNLYDSWSWLGGHADGEADLMAVALREVQEESGVEQAEPLCSDIFSVETLTVEGHEKHGAYVPSHLHLNLTYLIEADDTQTLRRKPDENSAVKWFPLDEAVSASSEPWFRERIYAKLNRKLRRMVEKGNI